ncbi:hypothetical protein [uncultured Alistipes sp.]|uniref:hypothetical protein n=1 Tax=uncultured Alistipes sp. TaxID=538949 RepID=UPI0026580090|nr:hypothetical protein [uncultured Alistipes sp.]
MGYYGNSGGRNRGKKYIRGAAALPPSAESEERAQAFARWFALEEESILAYLSKRGDFDAESYGAAYLSVWDAIARRGVILTNYRAYFLRTYFTARLSRRVNDCKQEARHVPIEEARGLHSPSEGGEKEDEESPLPSLDEVLDYVRSEYPGKGAAYFEIYVSLWPDVTYDRVAEIAGVTRFAVWSAIGRIRRDLEARWRRMRRVCDPTDARDWFYLSKE